jgi:hypothetical protein
VQLARALARRSLTEPIWRAGLRGNPVLVGMLAATLAPARRRPPALRRRDLRDHRHSRPAQLAAGACLALAILVLMEIDEALRGRSTCCAPERTQLAADLA